MRKGEPPHWRENVRHLTQVVLLLLISMALAGCDSSTGPEPMPLQILTDFEGASLGGWALLPGDTVDFTIREDTNSEFARWYSFRVRGDPGTTATFRILNAGDVSAAGAWPFNRPAVSSDGGASWSRIADTELEEGVFTFRHSLSTEEEWVALGPVYNFSRWLAKVDEIRGHPKVDSLVTLSHTIQGRPVHLVKITDPSIPDSQKGAVWCTGRQHPAEVAGSWMAEGLLDWLLSGDAQADELLRRSVFYMVPFLNPDGVALGNYRVNSVGANLNREWTNRNPATAPSVAATAQAIEDFVASGRRFEFFVDFHAYSSLRKNFFFFTGRDRAPEEDVQEIEALMDLFQGINGDFTRTGSSIGGGDPRLAQGWVFENFGVQSVTFEASYQDVTYGSLAGSYMSPERYLALGEGLGKSLAQLLFNVNP